MTRVRNVLDAIARQCSISTPANGWVAATQPQHVEIRDGFVRETVDNILDRIDFPEPVSESRVVTGIGAEEQGLPTDFLRLHRQPLAVYHVERQEPCVAIHSDAEYEFLKTRGAAGARLHYRLHGYEANWKLDFYPIIPVGDTVMVSYVTRNWLMSGSTAGYSISTDEDIILLPRRLVEAGAIWRFRERKGLPFADKQTEYETLMVRYGRDSRTLRTTTYGDTGPYWPFNQPVPNVITGEV
ncbi:MAG TPA: hypothetical protein PLH75_10300 [Amaricoccus sp.]|nr:hypothetical protein [Amaricoccus sp.]HRX74153.1 hypothetical protein [Hyphomonas sp.]